MAGYLNLAAFVIEHGFEFSTGFTSGDHITYFEGAILDQQGGNDAPVLSSSASMTVPTISPAGLALDLRVVRHQQDGLQ